jgi:hypothetical protein
LWNMWKIKAVPKVEAKNIPNEGRGYKTSEVNSYCHPTSALIAPRSTRRLPGLPLPPKTSAQATEAAKRPYVSQPCTELKLEFSQHGFRGHQISSIEPVGRTSRFTLIP